MANQRDPIDAFFEQFREGFKRVLHDAAYGYDVNQFYASAEKRLRELIKTEAAKIPAVAADEAAQLERIVIALAATGNFPVTSIVSSARMIQRELHLQLDKEPPQ